MQGAASAQQLLTGLGRAVMCRQKCSQSGLPPTHADLSLHSVLPGHGQTAPFIQWGQSVKQGAQHLLGRDRGRPGPHSIINARTTVCLCNVKEYVCNKSPCLKGKRTQRSLSFGPTIRLQLMLTSTKVFEKDY